TSSAPQLNLANTVLAMSSSCRHSIRVKKGGAMGIGHPSKIKQRGGGPLLRLLTFALAAAASLGIQSASARKLKVLQSFWPLPNGYGCFDVSQPQSGLAAD